MKEIIELNKRLLEQLGKCFSEGVLVIGRHDQPDELARLPGALRKDIEQLREEINQVVPNDFTYAFFLGDDSPNLTIEYEDGAQTGFFRGHEWQSDRSIIEQLKGFNWDAERKQAIAGCQMFDEMRQNAKHMPSRLPSTKETQKAFRDEMKDFVRAKRKDPSKVHVMLWRDHAGITEENFKDLESFTDALIDLMPTKYLIVTVVADGKPLPVEKIELLKKKALKELESMPISHARALGKF